MPCTEVPKEDFPPQSPGYKPADGQTSLQSQEGTSLSSHTHLTQTTPFTGEAQGKHGQIPSMTHDIKYAAKSLNLLKNWGHENLISEVADYG